MKKDTSKSTMLVISMGFLILYLLFSWQWAVIVSLVVGLMGIVSNALSKRFEWVWMTLSRIFSYVMPSILLGIIFYLFLFPLSLLSKLFTKDPLMLLKKYSTYFVNVEKTFDKKNMEKPW
jgi:hypothetical protein